MKRAATQLFNPISPEPGGGADTSFMMLKMSCDSTISHASAFSIF